MRGHLAGLALDRPNPHPFITTCALHHRDLAFAAQVQAGIRTAIEFPPQAYAVFQETYMYKFAVDVSQSGKDIVPAWASESLPCACMHVSWGVTPSHRLRAPRLRLPVLTCSSQALGQP